MSVAIRTATRIQDQDDVNVSLGVGVDEYVLTYDHDTAKFVLRAPVAAPDLSGYALLAGRAGGQTLYGGTDANDDITIHGTSSATRTTSYVLLQPTAGSVGIGTAAPLCKLDISSGSQGGTQSLTLQLVNEGSGVGTGNAIQFATIAGGTNKVAQIRSAVTGSGVGDLMFDTASANAFGNVMVLKGSGNVGINDTAPAEKLDVNGNINTTGVVKVDDVQVLSNRVIDARASAVANSGDATTDGLIDALRDAMIAHGLIAAA